MTLEISVFRRDMRDDHPEQYLKSCDHYDCDGIQFFPNISPDTDEYKRRTLVSKCTVCGETRNVSTESKFLTLRFRIMR